MCTGEILKRRKKEIEIKNKEQDGKSEKEQER